MPILRIIGQIFPKKNGKLNLKNNLREEKDMREVKPLQKRIGQLDIADIIISTRSRDDVPDILRGLQYLYTNDVLREQLFFLLDVYFIKRNNNK